MKAIDYAAVLKATREELDRLRREREQNDVRIAKLEQIENALSAEVEDAAEERPLAGVTDVVRNILKTANEPLSAIDVRDKMLTMGFDASGYSQFLASIHVVLKRLTKSNEAFEFASGTTKTYWWSTNPRSLGVPYPRSERESNAMQNAVRKFMGEPSIEPTNISSLQDDEHADVANPFKKSPLKHLKVGRIKKR